MFSSNATQVSAVTQAEAVDFDGTNDYLSRSTDLTGNADGKTFTFSCWLWRGEIGSNQVIYQSVDSQYGLYIYPNTSNTLSILGYNSSNTQILNATVTVPFQVGFTFFNILISIDMANTANRAVYINDVAATVTWTTYTNAAINFTCPNHTVGQSLKGRLSNVFLDYTYRDLSNSANRRLFVTADLKPAAGQAALNPILYLPMSDPTTVGTNAGTGGNFTLTGTVARSGRGPNQYNAPYSDLDGTADYLERTTAPTGIADGKQFTFSVCINIDTLATNPVFVIATSTTPRLYINIDNGSGDIDIGAYNSSGTLIFRAQSSSGTLVAGRNYQFVASFDLSNTSNRYAYLNGQALTMTYPTYLNQDIDFAVASTPVYRVGRSASTIYSNAKLGAFWFNTSYIDLSVAANLAKFVSGTGINAKPVDLGATGELPTGTAPLIYLPMYGNNAGKNYGTGGDFTVNSGPYTGARGPNEFWGNKADFDGTTGYLSRTTALGLSDGKTFSISFWYAPDSSSAANYIYYTDTSGGSARVYVLRDASNNLNIVAKNSAGTNVLNATVTTGVFSSNATAKCIQICIDLTSTSLRKIYVDGVNQTSITWTTYTNDNINWNVQNTRISTASNGLNGKLSEFYFTTEYIDFTQEANRLKFRDAFGNPTDLPSAITALSVPSPAVYMRFPPTSFGTNSGTGGDFTVNGTITDGGQL